MLVFLACLVAGIFGYFFYKKKAKQSQQRQQQQQQSEMNEINTTYNLELPKEEINSTINNNKNENNNKNNNKNENDIVLAIQQSEILNSKRNLLIKYDELKNLSKEVIGSGQFGIVFKAKWRGNISI